ncbi:hypothetical protein [Bilophila wadsworthia]|uniref:hypothetical protein n=1 Tax=Bilophila wadsworthia TaxID=35833 RepID=UPI0032207534
MTIPQKKGSGNAGRSSEFFGVKRIMEQAPHHHARYGGRSGIRAIPLLLLRKRYCLIILICNEHPAPNSLVQTAKSVFPTPQKSEHRYAV